MRGTSLISHDPQPSVVAAERRITRISANVRISTGCGQSQVQSGRRSYGR
jgi:hypothetical protein